MSTKLSIPADTLARIKMLLRAQQRTARADGKPNTNGVDVRTDRSGDREAVNQRVKDHASVNQ